jgi:hypothetical protein
MNVAYTPQRLLQKSALRARAFAGYVHEVLFRQVTYTHHEVGVGNLGEFSQTWCAGFDAFVGRVEFLAAAFGDTAYEVREGETEVVESRVAGAGFVDDLVEQVSGGSHEWRADGVLTGAGCLTDEKYITGYYAAGKHDLVA